MYVAGFVHQQENRKKPRATKNMDIGQILKHIKSVFNSHQKDRYPNSAESMIVRPAGCPTADR